MNPLKIRPPLKKQHVHRCQVYIRDTQCTHTSNAIDSELQSYISAAASNGSNGDASGHASPIQQPSIEYNRIHKHVYTNINESQRTSTQEISIAIELIYFQNAFGKK